MILAGGAEEADVYSVDLTHDEIAWTPESDFLAALKKRGLDLEPISCGGNDPIDEQREQWTDGANVFAVAPGIIVCYDRNERTADELDRHGYEIVRDDDLLLGRREIDPKGSRQVRHPALDDRAGPRPRRPALHDDAPRPGAAPLTRGPLPRASRAAAALLAAALAACGGKPAPAPGPASKESGVGYVSLSRVPVRTEPKASGAVVALLPRGSEVRVEATDGAFTRVVAAGGRAGWLEAGTFESAPEKEARERRTTAVADFATIPGRIVAPCPVYLAPDFGAARWGALEDGDPVEVVLADHDFLGVRLLGIPLAFVPAHAVRYLSPPPPTPAVPEPAPVAPPAVAGGERPAPGGAGAVAVPVETEPASPEPYAALPFGAEPPVLKKRVEPQYPAGRPKGGPRGRGRAPGRRRAGRDDRRRLRGPGGPDGADDGGGRRRAAVGVHARPARRPADRRHQDGARPLHSRGALKPGPRPGRL